MLNVGYVINSTMYGILTLLIGIITFFMSKGLIFLFKLDPFVYIVFIACFGFLFTKFLFHLMHFVLIKAHALNMKFIFPSVITVMFGSLLITSISLIHVIFIFLLVNMFKEYILFVLTFGLIICFAYGEVLKNSIVSLYKIEQKK